MMLRRVTCGCAYDEKGALQYPCAAHGEAPTAQAIEAVKRMSLPHGVPTPQLTSNTLEAVVSQRDQLWALLDYISVRVIGETLEEPKERVQRAVRAIADQRWTIHNPQHTELAVPVPFPRERSESHAAPTPVVPDLVAEVEKPSFPPYDEWLATRGREDDDASRELYDTERADYERLVQARGGVPFSTMPTKTEFP